jgi:S1-C subfamily serine protease
MFVEAIETAAKYTRPIHTITRTLRNDIFPGAATLFFINDEGYALTCRHVIELLIKSEKVNAEYRKFSDEKDKIPRDGKYTRALAGLKLKYKYKPNTTIQLKNTFINCVDTMTGFTCHLHPKFDLAILKLNGFNKLYCNTFASFKRDSKELKQGMYLCRMGFPFPEFNNYKYDSVTDDIVWTKEGKKSSPRFPMEGMITRFIGNDKDGIHGLELSTPGLKGQSGGPLFDKDGVVCGMQSSTKHLHLGFDIEGKEIVVKGETKKVDNYSFMHLGQCIHVDIIKKFLQQHKVSFSEV